MHVKFRVRSESLFRFRLLCICDAHEFYRNAGKLTERSYSVYFFNKIRCHSLNAAKKKSPLKIELSPHPKKQDTFRLTCNMVLKMFLQNKNKKGSILSFFNNRSNEVNK